MAIIVHLRRVKRAGGYCDWQLRWRHNGREPTKVIGRVGKLSKRDAERERREWEGELNAGDADPLEHRRDKMRLAGFIEWHDELICDHPARTRYNYRNAFSYLVNAVGEDAHLDRIDATSVARLKQQTGVEGRNLREATRDKIISYLRAAWNRAVKAKLVRENPFSGQSIRWDPKAARIFSVEEIEAMAEAAPSEWWRTFVLLLANTGLRRCEALYLRWADLDLDADPATLRVSRQDGGTVTIGGQEYHLPRWTAKAKASYRTVPLPAHVADHLRRWQLKSAGSPYVLIGLRRLAEISGRVQRGTWGMNEAPIDCLHRTFPRVQQAARALLAKRRGVKVEKVDWPIGTPHDLRDTYVLRLVNAGVPVHVTQRLVGHANPTVTLRFYTQAAAGDTAGVLAALQGTTREQSAAGVA